MSKTLKTEFTKNSKIVVWTLSRRHSAQVYVEPWMCVGVAMRPNLHGLEVTEGLGHLCYILEHSYLSGKTAFLHHGQIFENCTTKNLGLLREHRSVIAVVSSNLLF